MREVLYAKFHQVLFVPGLGQIGDSLPNQAKSLRIKMHETSSGILATVNGIDCLVPWPNVVVCTFAKESVPVVPPTPAKAPLPAPKAK